MFPNIRTVLQHGVMKLYHAIFDKIGYLPQNLIKIIIEWFLVNYQIIYFEVSEKIDDFYLSVDNAQIFNKSTSMVASEYYLYRLLNFGFGEVFNLFIEKVVIWKVIKENYASNPLIELFKRTVANILKIDYYIENCKEEDRFNTYDSTMTYNNFNKVNANQIKNIKSICTDFLL